jgi:hypothetical protein
VNAGVKFIVTIWAYYAAVGGDEPYPSSWACVANAVVNEGERRRINLFDSMWSTVQPSGWAVVAMTPAGRRVPPADWTVAASIAFLAAS